MQTPVHLHVVVGILSGYGAEGRTSAQEAAGNAKKPDHSYGMLE